MGSEMCIRDRLRSVFKIIRDARNEEHGIPSEGRSVPFSATEEFKEDIGKLFTALKKLSLYLEIQLGISGRAARIRSSRKKSLPKVVNHKTKLRQSFSSYCETLVGKTISRMSQNQFVLDSKGNYSKLLLVEFTDGSKLALISSSNGRDVIESAGEQLIKEVDFYYVPSAAEEPDMNTRQVCIGTCLLYTSDAADE